MDLYLQQFNTYLNQYIEIDTNSVKQIYSQLKYIQYKKGDVILEIGHICKYQYFILKGFVITYEPDNTGKDHVIQIGADNSWIGDLGSYTKERPSVKYLQAAEDCSLLLLDKQTEKKMLEAFPVLEKLFRILFQTAYIKQTERVSMMLISDAEKRFQLFKQLFPELIGRVEWKVIASYLDMSPETLSRIKNK
jgi:CRP-like cAMP-binding protein